MAHKHSVYDSDLHFAINPITRTITNKSSQKTTLIQYDHNSERFTFELPRYVEGHDMSTCNVVEIHYLNIDAVTKETAEGIYPVSDLQISPEDENVVICSWLISQNATRFVGLLNFLVRFACTADGIVDYVWNTAICTGINVSSGIYNSEIIIEQFADIIEQWKASIESSITENVTENMIKAVKDGTISNVDIGYVKTFKTIGGTELKFFVGSQAEYDTLSEEEKENLFAIITDDTSYEDMMKLMNSISERMKEIENKAVPDKLKDLGNTTDNVARHVWFSDSEVSGMPRKDDDFKYNPSTNTLQVNNIANSSGNSLLPTVLLGESKEFSFTEAVDTGITLPSGKSLADICQANILLYESGFYPRWVLTGSVMTYDNQTCFVFSGAVDQEITNNTVVTSYSGMAAITAVDGKVYMHITRQTGVLHDMGEGSMTDYTHIKRYTTNNIDAGAMPFYGNKAQVQLYFK